MREKCPFFAWRAEKVPFFRTSPMATLDCVMKRSREAVVMMVVLATVAGGALTSVLKEQQHINNGTLRSGGQESDTQEERDGKLFVILAEIPATPCPTTDNFTLGTCMPSLKCSSSGGLSKGSCASILSSCCLITRTCNEATSLNNTYFIHPGATNTELGACTLTINRVAPNICQMRFDFLALELSQPDTNGVCTKDFLTVTGGVSSVPVICGSSSGQHNMTELNRLKNLYIEQVQCTRVPEPNKSLTFIIVYYDVDPSGGAVKVTINRSVQASLSAAWNIQVTQIACDSVYRAPEGCLQHHTATAGTVYSFNFRNTAASPSANSFPNTPLPHTQPYTPRTLSSTPSRLLTSQCLVSSSRESSPFPLYPVTSSIHSNDHLMPSSGNYPGDTDGSGWCPAGTRQLASQDYGICIRRADNYCGITWEPVNDNGNYGFTISSAADAILPELIGTFYTSSRDSDCTTDYVVIPGGMYTTSSTSTEATPAGRYCGLGFPPTVTTTSQPFVLYVKTDDNEALDRWNRGFSLKYKQITSCA
ncbi:uncharacterized protein [Procambarus clarkii]|uniref:uncharacterized protein n=1 Tax=Procambarus clarkii TaxID=6728 RepID=UPI003743A360